MSVTSRRELLRAAGLAAAGGLGGCVLRDEGPGTGHIYVENTDNADHRVALRVVARSEGTAEGGALGTTAGGGTAALGAPDAVISAWYRVPQGYALEFQNVIESGIVYSVRAALPGAPPSDRVTGVIDTCSGDPAGERVISVRTRPDGLGIIPWGCKEAYSREDLNYVDPEDYRVESIEGTVADPPND
ncbi:hypothetical protein ACFQMA_09905 [Halosimplex aquaticum]|uniref:Tat (Twin-arginine translocation) pathway signal sequence n=1 Tax=Halosimplex aquaticum TaxID=3026162 RepID=A0ABD5XYL2_9EURY|nr:hypothetical protein [Halosimplex aquaticum]